MSPSSDLDYLRENPDSAGQLPVPGTDGEELLPFGSMGWENFERLCLAYAETTAEFVDASLYGTRGHTQQGIDLVLQYPDSKHLTVQCRRIKALTVTGLTKAVDDFLAGGFAKTSRRFVLATSAETTSPTIQDERSKQFARLRAKGIEFELWGRDRLSEKLRAHPGLLLRFFGEPWRDLYRPDAAQEDLRETIIVARDQISGQLANVVEKLDRPSPAEGAVTRPLSPQAVDRLVGRALQSLEPDVAVILQALHDADPAANLALIEAQVESDPGRASSLIRTPTSWIESGSPDLWNALGRLASTVGDWREAESAFLRAADVGTDDRAIYLVRAYEVACADDRSDDAAAHLSVAAELAPDRVSVRLSLLEREDDLDERLRILDSIEPGNDRERAAVARVRADTLASARRFDEALEALGAVLAYPALRSAGLDRRAGITVHQEGRLLAGGREPDRHKLRQAAEDSQTLAAELRPRGRFVESGQCVARSADALALAGEYAAAVETLGSLLPDERAHTDVRLSACQAAIHARDPEFALQLLGPEEEWGDDERAAAAHALVFSEEPGAQARAVEIAQEALDAGRDREQAAFVLVSAAMFDTTTAWPTQAAAIMEEKDPALHAQMRAERLVTEDRVAEAEEVLLAYADDVEVRRMLVDRHLAAERWAPALALVDKLITISGRGEDQMRRAAALKGLARRDALLAELRSVAGDADQPDELRRRAYIALTSEVAERDYPELARLSAEWREALPADPDALAQSIFAMARLAQHGDALALIKARDMKARTIVEAQLMAEVYFRAEEPTEAARQIAALSDQFDRPEVLEGILFTHSVRPRDADPPELAERLSETVRTFTERFPDSEAIVAVPFDEEHPEAFVEAMREQLRERRDRADVLHGQVRLGDAPIAVLAAGTGRQIGEIVLQLEALPLGFGSPQLDEIELATAREAIGGLVVWDAVSLTVVSTLPSEVQDVIVGRLPGSSIAAASLADVDAATVTKPSGEHDVMAMEGEQLTMTKVSAEEVAHEHAVLAGALKTACEHMAPLPDVDPNVPDRLDAMLTSERNETLATWPATLSVARRQGAAVYSDDRFVRLSARQEGLPAFGTLALLTVLHERGLQDDDSLRDARLGLLRRGCWGACPTGDELQALAAETEWRPTGAWVHAIADPASWVKSRFDQLRLCVEFLSRVDDQSTELFDDWVTYVVSFGIRDEIGLKADALAVVLLMQAWVSPRAFADLDSHRGFSIRLARSLHSVPRRLVVLPFEALVERAAALSIAAVRDHVRGGMFKWIIGQVTFLDAGRLFRAFVD